MSGADPKPGFALRSWRDPAVVTLALMALASGFGQFGAVAALGDVAKHFGRVVHGDTIASQAGLSGTELGVGLAILRLASLGGLPADRPGRPDRAGARCWWSPASSGSCSPWPPRLAPATGGSSSSSRWAARC